MTERNTAAVDVDLVGIELQFPDAGNRLRRERFIQLDETDLIDRETGPLQRFLRGGNRTQSHAARIYTCHSGRYDSSDCRPSPPLAALRRRHQQCCRTVVDAAGTRSGDGPFLLER